MYSWELKLGEAKPVDVFGTNLVLFRTPPTTLLFITNDTTNSNANVLLSCCLLTGSSDDGKVAALDAYCPHLGANLGIGGKVCGDSIECPFHGWRFDQSGTCVAVPGQSTVPHVAKLRSWPILERNGMILVWHDVDEKPPAWEPPVVPEIESGQFIRHAFASYTINVHNQDIYENGADVAHIHHLHRALFPAVENYFHNAWQASYRPGKQEDNDAHIAYIQVTQDQFLCPSGSADGWRVKTSHVVSDVRQIGPGLVYVKIDSPVGLVYAFETVTPKESLEQEVRLTFWAPPHIPRVLAKFVAWGYLISFEQDLAIWNNKTHVAKPVLSRSDKMIPPLRRWGQQFYSENSYKAGATLNPLDW